MNKLTCERCGKKFKNERDHHCHYVHFEDKPLKTKLNHAVVAEQHPEWFQNICTKCHAEVHGITYKKQAFKDLVIFRDRAIIIKNALTSQIISFTNNELTIPTLWENEVKLWKDKIKEIEKEIKSEIEANNIPIKDWLLSIKGVSYNTVAKILGYIDIHNTPTISALWRYAGLDPSVKRTRGMTQADAKKGGNPFLKKEMVGILGDSFIKQRTTPYRGIYDTEKERQLKVKKVTKNHAHRRAIRKMMKIFLSNLWVEWRKAEGLKVSKPYVQAKLGHKNIIN